ncbi:MAG: esterase family protein [Rhodococcus sp.]|nr:esterase family protein [Rhodococcus sp. (in: high G+C Gram-positive bacteria)]
MRRSSIIAASAVFALSFTGVGLVAVADPAAGPAPAAQSRQATVERTEKITDQRTAIFVHSPSMNETVQVQVLHPASGGPRPTLYLLDGVGAGEESNYAESTWTLKTDIVDFMSDKNANVVLPIGGTATYYADWSRPDPALGTPKWETFLTKELPPIIDRQFNGNGANSIAGVSMGAMGAANLATRHPELYRGLTAFSGCLDNTEPSSRDSVRGTIAYKGGDPANLWGPDNDPLWAANDPTINAEALRGKQVYISTGNGMPGPHEMARGGDLASTIALGGPLEFLANICTRTYQNRLGELGIPATFVYHNHGTHSWPYWQDEFKSAWPEIARGLGI